jgi:hypothetical protein
MPPTNNVFNKVNWVAMTGLDMLLNELAIGSYFSDEYGKDFAQKFAIGNSMQIPFSQRYIAQRNDMSFNPQAMDRPVSTLTVDQTATIGIEWDSIEKALDMERGEERVEKIYLRPAINYIKQAIETDLAQFAYRYTNMVTGALGTNPATYDATSATALRMLQEMDGQMASDDLGLFVPPVVNQAVKTSALTFYNPTVDISKQFRTGYVNKSDSFDWYSSMTLASHTAGTWAVAASVTCNGASQTGSSLAINCTAGDTFKFGDKISIANVNQVNQMTRQTTSTSTAGTKTFTITADVTATGATATLPIWPPIYGPGSHYQNVDALNAANALLTLWPGTTSPSGKSGKVALAMAKGAFFVTGVALQEPQGSVEFCRQVQDPKTGISVRVIRQYLGNTEQMITRLDALWGRGVGLSEQCSVVIACA